MGFFGRKKTMGVSDYGKAQPQPIPSYGTPNPPTFAKSDTSGPDQSKPTFQSENPTTSSQSGSDCGEFEDSDDNDSISNGPPEYTPNLVVAIDFGTTFSGVSFASNRFGADSVRQVIRWPHANGNLGNSNRKVPSALTYSSNHNVQSWGNVAKHGELKPGQTRCEWFKLYLGPDKMNESGESSKAQLPPIPDRLQAEDVVTDYLRKLWVHSQKEIKRELGTVGDLDSASIVLTVPAAWSMRASEVMRDAALEAGLVRNVGDSVDRKSRVHVITEPEAAAVHAAHLTELHKLSTGGTFMIIDAGGGTVDIAIYQNLGSVGRLEIAECCAGSGVTCGSVFLELAFADFVRQRLAKHPELLNAVSLNNFVKHFAEGDKLTFKGDKDDEEEYFRYPCFTSPRANFPDADVHYGHLEVSGLDLKQRVFQPITSRILELIDKQIGKAGRKVDALVMVGGFSGSPYLFDRVKRRYAKEIPIIVRPPDCESATVRGAARYGLSAKSVVSTIVARKALMLRVMLPAEEKDWSMRPGYIQTNSAGRDVCQNRLSYIIRKGAIVRKNQQIIKDFCKRIESPSDLVFTAKLYQSISDREKRYTDEKGVHLLANWNVDLSQISIPFNRGGKAKVQFSIGLEIDSAEIRGHLIYQGKISGSVTFDFVD